ncbi:ABC transporter ATP-binding protein [Hufsiella ginkgonis]|uniref:ATP-binding cassette domain-containing protein n=1 Tax=Hufsiella ginkgonis TaxID=2695274 RepID=A0A7K1XYT3_9SPHI|nr:ABC transporter ATP-binding protein [Hufsiella ginkgonis]MXV15988.1 ATP-binding cassette domain-containing protein [Hufsiella ginkgonis]
MARSRIYPKPEDAPTPTFKERLSALGNVPRFLLLVWKTNPGLVITSAVLRVLRSAVPLAILYVGKLIIDHVVLFTREPAGVSHERLWELVALEFGLAIAADALSRGISLCDSLLGDQFANQSSVKIMRHAAKLDLDQFEDSVFYDKLERARQQTVGRTLLLSAVMSQAQDLVTMGFLAVGLLAFSPWLIALLLLAIIPSFLGESHFNNQAYVMNRWQTPERRELDYVRYLGASDETAKEIKIFDLSDFIVERFRALSAKFYNENRRLVIRRATWGVFFSMLGSVGYYAAYVIILVRTINGRVTIGELTFLAGSFRQMKGYLEGILTRFTGISQGAIYLGDFFEFFEIQPKIRTAANPLPFPRPIKTGFTFENVGFRYLNSERWANRGLSFTLHPGEKLALVGENGAGKTTLVKLLARLYDPTEGRILLDGVDLREYDLSDLRLNMGIIFQDYLRYQMTLAQNIAAGNIREADNRELIMAAAKSSLADELANRLPGQYDQVLGKRFANGVELSGGEWQKIALARAYMKDAQLLILDEPTAALDARAEYQVFERFAELTKGKSAVLISHRFSTVRMADRILVLEKGRLMEIGSHEELLAKRGRYAELFELQAMGYK